MVLAAVLESEVVAAAGGDDLLLVKVKIIFYVGLMFCFSSPS